MQQRSAMTGSCNWTKMTEWVLGFFFASSWEKRLLLVTQRPPSMLRWWLAGMSREWSSKFFEHEETVESSKQGRYQRSRILWSNEDFNKKATIFIRENANIKGRPNLTVATFCEWVNDNLLPNETLEPGFPCQISVETARKWMHELGFEVMSKKARLSMGMSVRT